MNNVKLHPRSLIQILLNLNIIRLWLVCNGSCTTFSETSKRMFVPNKTEDINVNVFNVIIKKMNQKH